MSEKVELTKDQLRRVVKTAHEHGKNCGGEPNFTDVIVDVDEFGYEFNTDTRVLLISAKARKKQD